MIKKNCYYGNEICCCSYACLNVLQNASIDLQLFEVSTSVPFGVKHYENAEFDRLLTTYRDPNKGIDRALKLWGYSVEKYETTIPEKAIRYLRGHLKEKAIVLGPIDMGQLQFYVLPGLLKCMDHYIALKYLDEEHVLCYDSEGFYGYPLSYSQLEKCMNINDLYEAEHKITLRSMQFREDFSYESVLKKSYEYAFDNFRNAECDGQGSEAFKKCYDYICSEEEYKWKLPLLYDIEYLLQRKLLLKGFMDQCHIVQMIPEALHNYVIEIIRRQWKLLEISYKDLSDNKSIRKDIFYELGERERELDIGC